MLIFFDDILICSRSLDDYRVVLRILKENRLFSKLSKCKFGCLRVDYLGHEITENGISIDSKKIQAMEKWPLPKNTKSLRGFLGLMDYYRKFVKAYDSTAAPLNCMLWKGRFKWMEESKLAFKQLKNALISPPVLAMPNFGEDFVLECDASKVGIGAVLMQKGHPLAYISQGLKGRALSLSIYEKEMLSILLAIQKCRQYLLGCRFIIRTDQRSLKFLLDQRFCQESQHSWLLKLAGFDYVVEYKKGWRIRRQMHSPIAMKKSKRR